MAGQGGSDNVGGISASVEMDDTKLPAQLAKLRAALDTVDEKLHILGGSFAQVGVAGALTQERLSRLTASKIELKSRIDDVTAALVREAAATRQLDTAGGRGRGGFAAGGGMSGGALSRAAIDISRGVEDFAVAGPLGVLNNVPGIVANIGQAAKLSAGQIAALTTGFSLAATAAYVLYQNADKLVDLLPQLAKDAFGMTGTKTEAEAMALLGEKTHKTAEDQKRLNEYKQESQRIDAMMELKSKTEKAVAAGVQDVIAEADSEAVLAAIIKGRMKDKRFLEGDEKYDKLRDIRQKRDNLKEDFDAPLSQQEAMSLGAAGAAPGVREQKLAMVKQERRLAIARLDDEEIALRKEMFDRQRKEAQRLIDGAQKDPAALIAEARKNPQFFPGTLVDQLEKNTPGAIKNRAIDAQTDAMLKKKKEADAAALAKPLADQDAAAVAGDQVTKDAFAAVAELKARNDENEGVNAEETDRFMQLQAIGERFSEKAMGAIRSSRVMDVTQLNASVQSSINNDDPMKRLLEEAKESSLNLKEIRGLMVGLRNMGQPVRPGGR